MACRASCQPGAASLPMSRATIRFTAALDCVVAPSFTFLITRSSTSYTQRSSWAITTSSVVGAVAPIEVPLQLGIVPGVPIDDAGVFLFCTEAGTPRSEPAAAHCPRHDSARNQSAAPAVAPTKTRSARRRSPRSRPLFSTDLVTDLHDLLKLGQILPDVVLVNVEVLRRKLILGQLEQLEFPLELLAQDFGGKGVVLLLLGVEALPGAIDLFRQFLVLVVDLRNDLLVGCAGRDGGPGKVAVDCPRPIVIQLRQIARRPPPTADRRQQHHTAAHPELLLLGGDKEYLELIHGDFSTM